MIVERELDEILATEPDRDLPMRLCVKAWVDLNSCRPIGMSVGPIPWDKMVKWCEFHDEELDREAAMQLIGVIQGLDRDFMIREASKRALASAQGK